jgi:hypothetical protein
MGTSISFRSPPTARWEAFGRAMQLGLPLERVRAALFLAAEDEWRQELSIPAFGAYVDALIEAHSALPDRLRAADVPSAVIQSVVTDARHVADDEAGSAATALAERALERTLLSVARTDRPLALLGGAEAADAWEANRGAPETLARHFLGELLGQFARHAAARDLPALVGSKGVRGLTASRQVTEALGDEASRIALLVPLPTGGVEEFASRWASVVDAAFAEGRRWAPHPDA